MILIRKFITDDDVNYYKGMSNEEIKYLVKKVYKGHREIIGLPNGNIDVLLKQFREDNFTEYRRRDKWGHSYTKVLDNNGSINEFYTRTAQFNFKNKWNQEEDWIQEYKIIVDENMKILWIGIHKEDQYFISAEKEIYEIKYKHKEILLFSNICDENEYFCERNDKKNDDLVRKYFHNMRTYKFGTTDNIKDIFRKEKVWVSISIDEYFEKRFFYKGFKWNQTWKDYHGYNYITLLIDIVVKNGLFCIEIENVTYPFYGYLLLDLKELKIVEAKKNPPLASPDKPV